MSQTPEAISNMDKDRTWFAGVKAAMRAHMAEILVYSVVINLIAVASPIFVLQVYDRVVFSSSRATLTGLIIGMVIAVLFDYLLRQARAKLLRSTGTKIDIDLANRIYDRLTASPLRVLEQRPAAYWQALYRDADTVRNTFSGASALLLADLPFAVLFAIVIFLIAPAVSWVLLIVFPLFLIVAWWSGHTASANGARERQAGFTRDSAVAELISGRVTIKSMALSENLRPDWESTHADALTESLHRGQTADRFIHFGLALTMITTVAMTSVGALAILDQSMSIGALVAANMLAARIISPFQQLVANWRGFIATRGAIQRLDQAFALPVEQPHGAVEPVSGGNGEIWLDGVSYTYADGYPPAINHLGLKLGNGFHALIGANGSGKSTLLKLIYGLYRPLNGRVLIDGADIAQFGRRDVAALIGYVPQHTHLMAGTIRENIALSMPDAEDSDITRAAELAGAHAAISALPAGYGTTIGEGGMDLPGGIRQRIAIARALIGDPGILLMDEPSGNLDTAATNHLAQALRALSRQKTIVVVTHSGQLLQASDNTIRLDQGRIIDAGATRDVMARMQQQAAPDDGARGVGQ